MKRTVGILVELRIELLLIIISYDYSPGLEAGQHDYFLLQLPKRRFTLFKILLFIFLEILQARIFSSFTIKNGVSVYSS